MENTRVIFSANAESMDSWDIENLKYLRKLSIRNPTGHHNVETISYHSDTDSLVKECEDLLDSAIYTSSEVNTNNAMKSMSHHDGPNLKSSRRLVEIVPALDENNNEEIPQPTLKKLEDRAPVTNITLDDCYIMDVLMVRNESVMTDNNKSVSAPSKSILEEPVHQLIMRKEMALLRGSISSPSSLSSDDSFTSAITKGFFDMDNNKGSNGNKNSSDTAAASSKRMNTRVPSVSTINYTRVQPPPPLALNVECPFCGGCGRTNAFYSSNAAKKREKMREVNAASMVPTIGGEPPPIDMPKTPSPYYIRIRKDLVPTNSPPLSMNKPSNFGLNKSGQLVIDYSSNWESLESYVKSLSSRPSTKKSHRNRNSNST